jgi:DNA polymerase III epsilon subunit-like protein
MSKPFLYFDTETTDTQIKDLIQLAFVTDTDVKLNMYFKPRQNIAFAAMAVHHITPEFLEDKSYLEEAKLPLENIDPDFIGETLEDYLHFLADKYIWVAHNADFDLEVLNRKGIKIPNYICTLKVARNMFYEGDHDLESYALQYLRYYLGLYKNENLDHNTAHDALSDVYFLRDLFHYMQEHSTLSAENMILISKEPQFMRQMTFGKYAGKTLEDIARTDRGYLEWIVDTMADKPDLQWNAKRVLGNDLTLF